MAGARLWSSKRFAERMERPSRRLIGPLASAATGCYARGAALLSVVYLLALLPLIRVNYSYGDDRGRVLMGYDGWENFSRYVSDGLSHVIHAGGYLDDISPLPQLIAIVLTAVAACVLIRAFSGGLSDGRGLAWMLVAAVPMGLSPYYLECLSFKFDAPYMALSLLASVAPLLLREKRCGGYVALATVVSTLVVCTTYQASLGVLPMAVLALAFVDWVQGASLRETSRSVAYYAVGWIVGVLLFRFVVMQPIPDVDSYVSSSVGTLGSIVANYVGFFSLVRSDFNFAWEALFLVITVCFIAAAVSRREKNKVLTGVFGIILAIAMFPLSFGVYPFLEKPLMAPRAMLGVGVFISIVSMVAITLTRQGFRSIPVKLAITTFSWSLIVFAATYGNAVYEQGEYERFRTYEVLNALASSEEYVQAQDRKIQVVGSIGPCPVVRNKNNALLGRLMMTGLDSGYFGSMKLLSYYNIGARRVVDIPEDTWKFWPVLDESLYHTIYASENEFVVVLK